MQIRIRSEFAYAATLVIIVLALTNHHPTFIPSSHLDGNCECRFNRLTFVHVMRNRDGALSSASESK